jgi:ABC-type antimicrobial peptide transport system permease subunit
VGTEGDFAKTLDLKLIAGRDIDMKNYPSDSTAILLNETAVKEMKMENPVGKNISENGKNLTIVGIFKDFIIGSPFSPITPMIVVATKNWTYNVILRFNNKNSMVNNLQIAQQVFKKYNPAYPFTYHFVDEEYQQKFNDEKQTGTLAALFAGLTIFISCLGLFGLAAYMAENRSKEIGIRKVLGANVRIIVKMLSKEFVVLVIVSIIIATPIGWLLMNKWLQNYNYRIGISWQVFVFAGLIAILIALITVSFQAIKAALANPVKSLRSE